MTRQIWLILLGLALLASQLAPIGIADAGGDQRGCGILGCGGNSPQILSHSLNPIWSNRSVVSESGFRTGGLQHGPINMDFEIRDGELFAVSGGFSAGGDAVINSEIVVFRAGVEYRLRIVNRVEFEYWTRPGEYVNGYHMVWKPVGGDREEELCEHPPPSSDPEWGAYSHYAFFVGGETYDVPSITVEKTGGSVRDVVYIACAGSALAKNEMNSYSANIEESSTWGTLPSERGLMLRVYAGAYCYGETAPNKYLKRFTEPLEPLLIEDAKGWMSVDYNQAKSVEAVWSESELVCLEEPRRLVEEPLIFDHIASVCRLPPTCSSLGLDDIGSDAWQDHGTIRTLVPF